MFNQNKMMYSVRDVTDYLSISSSCLYKAIANGDIDSVKYGRRRLFTKQAIEGFIAVLSEEYSTRRS